MDFDEVEAAGHLGRGQGPLVGQPPLEIAVEDAAPLAPQRSVEAAPAGNLLQQRPVRQVQVLLHVVQGIPRRDARHGLREQLLEVRVDGPGGAVEVDVLVEVLARVQEHGEGALAGTVQGQPLGGDEGVVDEPVPVDGSHRHAAHVRVPRHVVEVVEGEDAVGEGLEEPQPQGLGGVVLGVLLDGKGDVLRVESFSLRERARGLRRMPRMMSPRCSRMMTCEMSSCIRPCWLRKWLSKK